MSIINKKLKKKESTCAEELNILDIYDNIFYSLDNYISLYIKVAPVPFEYLSIIEKKNLIKRLYSELAGEKNIIKIIVMSLPISTKEINDFLNTKRNQTKNSFKKNMLLKQIEEIRDLSYNGEMVEKQVIIQIFEKVGNYDLEKLNKRGKELVLKLQNAGISSEILDTKQILQFFNSFLNMKFSNDNFSNIWSDGIYEFK